MNKHKFQIVGVIKGYIEENDLYEDLAHVLQDYFDLDMSQTFILVEEVKDE